MCALGRRVGQEYKPNLPAYRIHRLKDTARQQFRWAPHTAGLTVIRPRDYELRDDVEAQSCYAAWMSLRDAHRPLLPGDVLESETGERRIYKYVGFEQAEWQQPEVRERQEASQAETTPPSV